MKKQRFELIAGKSAKFWEVQIKGSSMTTAYGRLGTKGQNRVKDFPSPTAAKQAADKLIQQKVDKGYEKTGARSDTKKPSPKKSPKKTRTKRKVDAESAKKETDIRPIAEIRKAAKAGNAADQVELGYRYLQGKGVEKDIKKGEKWITKAADQGLTMAQYKLGYHYFQGDIGPKELSSFVASKKRAEKGGGEFDWDEPMREAYRLAVHWYQLAAKQGHGDAQVALAKCYMDGTGVRRDNKKAIHWFELATESGKINKDHAEAVYAHARRTDYGEGVAEEWLGYKLSYAELRAPNPRGAVKIYKQAAELDHAPAQHRLGVMYRDGIGVRRNAKTAFEWMRQAAESGDVNAQADIGLLYWDGRGISKNRKAALRWWRIAASQGSADAQYMIGEACASGTGTRKNQKEALRWFRKAAKNGSPDAQYIMGNTYLAAGTLTEKRVKQANDWHRKAAAQGHPQARRALTKRRVDLKKEIAHLHNAIDALAATREDDPLEQQWLAAFKNSICPSWRAIYEPIVDFEKDRISSMIGGWPIITSRYPSLPEDWSPILQLDLTEITRATGEDVGQGWLQLWIDRRSWGNCNVAWSKETSDKQNTCTGEIIEALALRIIPRTAVKPSTKLLRPKSSDKLVQTLKAWQTKCEKAGRPYPVTVEPFWSAHVQGHFLPWVDELDMPRPQKIVGWQPAESLLSYAYREEFDVEGLLEDDDLFGWEDRLGKFAESYKPKLDVHDNETCKDILFNYRNSIYHDDEIRPFPFSRSLFSFNGPAARGRWIEDVFDVSFERRSNRDFRYHVECMRWKN